MARTFCSNEIKNNLLKRGEKNASFNTSGRDGKKTKGVD
jgi:hypothetical protein